jgi:fructosamine-3-kinase
MSAGTALLAAVASVLGGELADAAAVGGDVNQAFRVQMADGRSLFVKHRPDAPAGMYTAEADGLTWLAQAGAVRVPRVVAVRDDAAPRFIALEWIEIGPHAGDHDEALGRGLAALHRAGAPDYGWDRDNFIATLPQPNSPCPSWPEFYATRRLEPLVRRARDRGLLPDRTARRVDAVCGRIEGLCGPPEPPARLHGDLWGGNAIADRRGEPVLIDPAVYGGHREVDLAMMRLFGGFSSRVFVAYDEAFPPADGHADRVALYQLQPLLVHVNLFGGGYVAPLERALARYAG